MNEIEIWKRVIFHPGVSRCEHTARQLYVPKIELVGSLPYELAGLLPNREHSKDLMVLIDDLPENKFGDLSVVGVFAADPFLNCKRIAERLIRKGYHQVVNIPPVTGYGTEFLAILDKVDLGQAQEQRNLARLSDRGLSVSVAVTAVDYLDAALSHAPRRLWVVPSYDFWRCDVDDTERLMRLCREISGRTDLPVVLAAGKTGISPEEATCCGANGIVLDD